MNRPISTHLLGIFVLVLAVVGCGDGATGTGGDGGDGGSGSGGSTGGSGGNTGGTGGSGGGGGSVDPCGNGNVDLDEECDGANLDLTDCLDLGNFLGGTLACDTACRFDLSGCERPIGCGNGVVDGGEDCDETNLGGSNCRLAGDFTGGELTCLLDCTFDTAACIPSPVCGNSELEAGEDCDGTNLGGADCLTVPGSFNAGTLACAGCIFDTSACAFDPCAEVASPCTIAGIACSASELVVCDADAFGCLAEARTNCALGTNGACDDSGAVAICTSDDPCSDQCAVLGAACSVDDLVVCGEDAFGCKIETTIDCTELTRGFCDDSGAEPVCGIAPDPCADDILCAGTTESVTCEPDTETLVTCALDLDGCLVRTRDDCAAISGGFCDAGVPSCDVDLCFGLPLCSGTLEFTECRGDYLLADCALDGNGCLVEDLSDCAASGAYCNPTAGPSCTVPACGNGQVEPGEECDPPDGSLCDSDCTLLSPPECGNGTVEPGEDCEPPDTATCDADCQEIVATIDHCGDGIQNALESCDGLDFGSDGPPTCSELLLAGGSLEVGCEADCTFNLVPCVGSTMDPCTLMSWYDDGFCDPCAIWGGTPDTIDCDSACAAGGGCFDAFLDGQWYCGSETTTGNRDPDCNNCGNGTAGAGEFCDGDDLAGADCGDGGFNAGTLACDSDCFFDFGTCTDPMECGNATVEPGEECEPPDTATCDVDCQRLPVCGDTFVDWPEQCEPPSVGQCDDNCMDIVGTALLGESCTSHNDCASTNCLLETVSGWPGGICTENCAGTGTCSDSAFQCVPLGAGDYCVASCVSHGDCNNGYICNDDLGLPSPSCFPRCHFASQCPTVTECNVQSGFCESTGGGAQVGAACISGADCETAFCATDGAAGPGTYPSGYCLSWCDPSNMLCPPGTTCGALTALVGYCFDNCTLSNECREGDGYSCQDLGFGDICYW